MPGADEMTAALLRKRLARKAAIALLGFLPFLAFGLGPAQAQFPFPWSYPYYDGYPPPMPPGSLGHPRTMAAGEPGPRFVGPDAGYGIVPLSEIRRRIALLGFHLIAIPRHKDRIYLAEAEDAHGLPHRLVFDAYQGTIIENVRLAPFPKKPRTAASFKKGQEKQASKPGVPPEAGKQD